MRSRPGAPRERHWSMATTLQANNHTDPCANRQTPLASYTRIVRWIAATACVLVASACTGESSRSEGNSQGAFPGAGVDCPTREPSPISPDLASDALNKHGFSVVFDDGACGSEAISGMLSNTSSGPTPREVMDREGAVVCFLLVRPRNDLAVPEVEGDTGAAHAERRLGNLSCDLYASRTPVDDEAARLDYALAEMRSSIR